MKKLDLNFLKRIPKGRAIMILVALALAIPAFVLTRNFVVGWEITNLPGVAVNYNEQGQPEIASELPIPEEVGIPEPELPPSWDGGSRVTLLFIGLDERDWEEGQGAPRSDTMILLPLIQSVKKLVCSRSRGICGSTFLALDSAVSILPIHLVNRINCQVAVLGWP